MTFLEEIDLEIFQYVDKEIGYGYKKKNICLFISGDNALYMPMGSRQIPLPPHSVYLFYDQNRDFEMIFSAETAGAFLIVIRLDISVLHKIISQGSEELNFGQANIFEKEQYHHFEPASLFIKERFSDIVANPQNILMREAKKFAILDDFFNTSNRAKEYKCPFLNQKDNVQKIKEAKEFLLADLQKTPTIQEISKHIGLNEYQLKTGFREIFGKTIHTYAKDYKLVQSKRMITSRQFQIAEIADRVGYTNVSHFIEAFKKKYGLTPKQYELGL